VSAVTGTVLVTGGTGLVGSRLLTRFVEAGIATRGLVRAGKELPIGVEAVEGDILDPSTLPRAFAGVTAVIHLAALFRTEDEAAIWRANLEGTRNLIVAATHHAPNSRFLMASTGNVYGPDLPHPAREDDPTTAIQAYPASKIQAEGLLRESGLNWGILRLPFVYGDRDGHLETLPKLAAARDWHPAEKLSVAHHADIAAAFELALSGVMDGQTVNIADEAPQSLYELAQLAGQVYPDSNEPLAHPWKGQMDASLARRLGFRPSVATVYQAAREGRL
jgi:nucleoside-diphosphate-sugar epimerase